MAPTICSTKTALSNKKTCAKAKENNSKKSKNKKGGKPKRPLSAYNLFFQHERDRILLAKSSPYGFSHEANHRTLGADPSVRTTNKSKKVRPPPHGKIGFAELAKLIGGRWRSLTSEERSHYDRLAEKEKERYTRDLRVWQLGGAAVLLGEKYKSTNNSMIESRSSSDVAALPVLSHSYGNSHPTHLSYSLGGVVAPPVSSMSTQPGYSAVHPDQTYSGPRYSYPDLTAAAPMTRPIEQPVAPRVISTEFSVCSHGSSQQFHAQHSHPSMTAMQVSQHSLPPTQQPVERNGNASWPILGSATMQHTMHQTYQVQNNSNATWTVLDSAKTKPTAAAEQSSLAIDADISRMLDLLMG
eukprot:CAMPEP_0113557660 /NCGR_PEP_ID=MMETSP0015_2-20120614/17913_1 /TAXON_ID=2838 /ORGANISM="Odontella" /LENGTH=354 /DNA_ID=CAMNT_0000459107 /DNA_START=73 /DNA_END=1137 /DNA_ORIENTATION=- /assembly_acc=CAM_ASM_000160